MPLYYLDSGTARSIRLNAASTTKEPGKSYLSSDSNARDTEGNRNLADASCFFRNEADDSNRFQIVRNKDGLLAAAPGEYIVFHAPEDNRDSWFILGTDFNSFYKYLKLGDKWGCIGDRYDDGVMYANLKRHGCWALGKTSDQVKGILDRGLRLSFGA
ncbi:hypothetical protein Q7P35_001383 [Cladosporium inversicolor]